MSGSDTANRSIDYGMVAIIFLVLVTALWVLLTPLVPVVAATTLRRFHLRSGSFATWAIQFPIPTMYNFANTFEVRKVPPGEVSSSDDENAFGERRYLNHFPMRIVTFGDTRFQYLAAGEDRWYRLESRYGRQHIVSNIHARPKPDGGFDIIRLADGGPDE